MTKIFDTPLYPYRRSPDQDAAKPVPHPVVIVGAGPVGLALAIDLAQQDVPVVVLDDNDKVSFGSRAICFAKRSLEILDRLGCGDALVDKGVQWNVGKVYFDERQVFEFNLLPEDGHKRPAFINLQQYYLEQRLVERLRELEAGGAAVQLRGRSRVAGVEETQDGVLVSIETPDGGYRLLADWLVACDGAGSPVRKALGLDFVGRIFEDNFLIADIVMADSPAFPVERRFWFDPPFNRGQSALLHKQPDNVWRIDLQLGWNIDRQEESRPEKVVPRLKAFLGEDAEFELDWVSIYTFQCRRMEKFRHGHVIFAGDSAHQVSPFGARGANSGLQDTDNLAWKLKLVLDGTAGEALIDSYHEERAFAADDNLLNSTRATDFISPKSAVSLRFRNAVLELASTEAFARPLVNSGRLSVPTPYLQSSLNTPDEDTFAGLMKPGTNCADAPLRHQGRDSWLLDVLNTQHGPAGGFTLLAFGERPALESVAEGRLVARVLHVGSDVDDAQGLLARRYDAQPGTVYLIRPDQHVAARWRTLDAAKVRAALRRCTAQN